MGIKQAKRMPLPGEPGIEVKVYYQFCFGRKITHRNRISCPSSGMRSDYRVRGLFVRRHFPQFNLRVKARRPLPGMADI